MESYNSPGTPKIWLYFEEELYKNILMDSVPAPKDSVRGTVSFITISSVTSPSPGLHENPAQPSLFPKHISESHWFYGVP